MTWPTEDDVTAVARILFLSITAHEDAAAAVGLDWSRIPAATRAPWEWTARRIVEQVAPRVAALVQAERAAALREAADAVPPGPHPNGCLAVSCGECARRYERDGLREWLRDRADAEEPTDG